MPLHLVSVDEHSPAQRLGLEPGCTLLAIDGNPLNDALDYQFYTSAPHFTLTICQNGAQQQISVEKGEYEPFGCNFKTYLGDEKHSCANHCMFCFIDQLPPGMREPLYFKDDDERLSFLYGNYITMTNLTDREVERIIKLHISPIFISVHTTNPQLRVRMMANKRAAETLRYLDVFAKGGIDMNCQLVLCRGINDGDELRRTLDDLLRLRPQVESIAAVPAGVTAVLFTPVMNGICWRGGKFPLLNSMTTMTSWKTALACGGCIMIPSGMNCSSHAAMWNRAALML